MTHNSVICKRPEADGLTMLLILDWQESANMMLKGRWRWLSLWRTTDCSLHKGRRIWHLSFLRKHFLISGAVFLRHLTFFFLFWSINGVWTLEGQIRQSLLFIESCPYTVLGQEKGSVFCKRDQLWWLWDYGSVAESDVIWEGNRTLKACWHSITSRGTDSSWNQVLCLLYSVFKITGVPSKFPACGIFFFCGKLIFAK